MNTRFVILIPILLTLLSGKAVAVSDPTCGGMPVNPITSVCWSCLFPITLGSTPIVPSEKGDTINPPSPVCVCPKPIPLPGLAMGYWEPTRLIDVTKKPFCFPNLGGQRLNLGVPVGFKKNGGAGGDEDTGSWHVHYYLYPVLAVLEIVTDILCIQPPDLDLAYITEFDPLWNSDELSFLINPEAVLFGNLIAQAACAADCIAASTHTALDPLFWCAGCLGSMYPMDGNIGAEYGHVQGASLAASRFIYKLHRQGIGWQHSGIEALCFNIPNPLMKKSEYRLQLINPVPNVVGPFSCPSIGASNALYEWGKTIPVVGEDYGFLVWHKENCCVL